MAYTAQYSATDIGSAAIDIAAGSLVGVAGQALIIGNLLGISLVLSIVAVAIASVFAIFILFKVLPSKMK
jgi:membrane protein implicated in regulation of membrane protease activity